MSSPILSERIEQIRLYDLPYTCEAGNTVTKNYKERTDGKPTIRIAGQLVNSQGKTVTEYAFPSKSTGLDFQNQSLDKPELHEILRNSSGGVIPTDAFAKDGDYFKAQEKFEFHAIYDSRDNITHLFILPHIKLLEKHSE